MTPFIKITAFTIAGCALGYFSAHHVISGRIGNLTLENNGWTLWRSAGKPEADPYTKAHFALRREIPLSGFEELVFSSSVDNEGNALSTSCTYRIESPVLPARVWSFSAIQTSQDSSNKEAIRRSFNTDNVVRHGGGSFEIFLSTTARPGNWLPFSSNEPDAKLVLSLLNPNREVIEDPSSAVLPKVHLEACG